MRRSISISDSTCSVTQIEYFDDVKEDFNEFINGIERTTKRKQKIEYYNIPCCFDIETSSFYDHGNKAGCMYIWMFSIDDHIIIGRSWDEFLLLLKLLQEKLSLHNKFRRLVCYIQNLGFEFQWFCRRIRWEKVFATDERAPLTALSEYGIEFRCSYRLSGYKLEKMGEQLTKYNVQKLTGDLDYKKLRLPADPKTGFKGTPLTDKEMGYCINDVRVLSAYIREKIEQDGGITKIPLTKTGYVRLYCREHIFGGRSHRHDYKIYHQFMQQLTLDPEELKMLLRAFQGGFTHASTFFSNKEDPIEEGWSYDYCSKYPSSLVLDPYPMSKGEFYTPKDTEDLKYQLSHYCCLFDVRFIGLKPKILYDNYISLSKCSNVKNPVVNNGRIVSADEIITTITETDLEIIKLCYRWDKIEIGKFIRYEKRYLPTEFVECVLDFYENKTTLKGLEGFEVEYMYFKELVNSLFGCCCSTYEFKDSVTYVSSKDGDADPGWTPEKIDLNDAVEKYNKKKDRFLFVPWGIWCTSYCRRDIWKWGILKVGEKKGCEYLYCDTDSVKFIGDYPDFSKEYNRMTLKKMLRACEFHHIDLSRMMPKTREGKVKPLGFFELDGHYKKAKFLGAKRYMVEYADDKRNGKKAGKTEITVAGLNKEKGAEYIKTLPDPFKAFCNELTVPKEYSGRQVATYIDEIISGTITDYLGNTGMYYELSALHLEESEYTMSIADDYLNYLLGIQERDDI